MFPYPSAKGLHVGHIKGYTATDVISRYKRAQGYCVVHPNGYDAFGLPAEQFAIATNQNPNTFTEQNIANFRRQLRMMGFNYDPDLEITTTRPEYYKWTQWIFAQLYKRGLAEIADTEVNWCEKLGTVLANEEIVTDADGNRVSERGSHPVVKKVMKQWVLKITKYADKLLDGLDRIDWPESVKKMQREWIGKSTGALVDFALSGREGKLTVFTTRPDTLFGVTFVSVAPENALARALVTPDREAAADAYLAKTQSKTDAQRRDKNNKSGVFTGSYAINPLSGKKVPIWISDYVLNGYGTGAVMGTPAHDSRDHGFARLHGLEIVNVVEHNGSADGAYEGDGPHVNSDFLNGLRNEAAIAAATAHLEANRLGKAATVYKLRDWIFSRQRYWGEPFPIVFDERNEPILDEDLPVTLPPMESFSPNRDGLPPLANATKWVRVQKNGKPCRRETNTMPQWAGSCWYYLAFLMRINRGPNDEFLPLNGPEAKRNFDRFLPVDVYVGGQEHAVLHLLYARFWHLFLREIGVVDAPEPFMRLINQGMILNEDGTKMSKSRGQFVTPEEICATHGADALRLYEMFMGPLTASLAWSDSGVGAMRKWLDRVWNLFARVAVTEEAESANRDLLRAYHGFVRQATAHLEATELNLLVSDMMVFVNACYKADAVPRAYLAGFVTILGFVCPFIAEALRESLYPGTQASVYDAPMPKHDDSHLVADTVVVSCMVNGKFRGSMEFSAGATQDEIAAAFLADPKIAQHIGGKTPKKVIYAPKKAISFVV